MADQFAQDRNMGPDSRAEFEADAEPMGFDLTRISLPVPEPWSEYADENTGHRWGGWLAATQRQQERIAYVEKVADDAIELGNQQAIRIAALEAQVQALSLDAGRLDWIAMHGGFGVDSVTGLPGGNGQKLKAATRAAIDAAIAAGKGEG